MGKSKARAGAARQDLVEINDPVLLMLGVGRELWNQESGNDFVERLRSEELPRRLIPARGIRLGDNCWRAGVAFHHAFV